MCVTFRLYVKKDHIDCNHRGRHLAKSQREFAVGVGPGEILRHGLELLRKDTDRNRRLAMICIDNAVELMMKTFLGLPKRVSGLTITRREFEECAESFPRLLDAMEKFASDRLVGVDLGNIEWYHRLRNELYHQGNGLTVERAKVEVYASLAKILFRNIFAVEVPELPEAESDESRRLLQFLTTWNQLERTLAAKAATAAPPEITTDPRPLLWTQWLSKTGDLNTDEARRLEAFRKLRNHIVHGDLSRLKDAPTDEIAELVKLLGSRWGKGDDAFRYPA
jgi:hypothetical protein